MIHDAYCIRTDNSVKYTDKKNGHLLQCPLKPWPLVFRSLVVVIRLPTNRLGLCILNRTVSRMIHIHPITKRWSSNLGGHSRMMVAQPNQACIRYANRLLPYANQR